MKITQERLAESYCRPKTEEEWKTVAGIRPLGKRFCHQKDAKSYWIEHLIGVVSDDTVPHDRTEIPVSHFTDLRHDSLAPWRLAEDGFRRIHPWKGSTMYELLIPDQRSITVVDGLVTAWNDNDDLGNLGLPMKGLTTYTDLITLMRLIG